MSGKAMTLSERLREPKAWMAWHDYGAVTIAGDPIPAMDHDSQLPRDAADALDAKDERIMELVGALEYWLPDESMLTEGYSQDAMTAWDRHIKILQRARKALK